MQTKMQEQGKRQEAMALSCAMGNSGWILRKKKNLRKGSNALEQAGQGK